MGSAIAVIPARAGSKGFPGKNLATLGGLPLVGHAIRLAQLCDGVDRIVVSTDSEEIAEAAVQLGAEVPFLRPGELARDETPMWPVLQHALREVDPERRLYEQLVLLSPTSPFRLPAEVESAQALLRSVADADGVVGVCEAHPNPLWVTVVERDGWMEKVWPDTTEIAVRQEVPEVLQINGALYVWRTSFVDASGEHWTRGRHVVLPMPRPSSVDIDEPWQLELAEAMLASGLVQLPWLG